MHICVVGLIVWCVLAAFAMIFVAIMTSRISSEDPYEEPIKDESALQEARKSRYV
ncbi:MAG: hypothetical protein GY943_27095 [Chloroflexi bacterium]|nr:hypothetical protein [Chloroflexota bacterium]